MSMFKCIGCFFHPVRSARIIKDLGEGRDRFESQIERALVSRLTGTYIKAYDTAYAEAFIEGTKKGRKVLIAQLQQAGIKMPVGVS